MWKLLLWIVVPPWALAPFLHARAAPLHPLGSSSVSVVRDVPATRRAAGGPTAATLQQVGAITAIVGPCFRQHGLLGAWHRAASTRPASGSASLDQRAAQAGQVLYLACAGVVERLASALGALSQRATLVLAGDAGVAAVTMLQCASDPVPSLRGPGQTPARQSCPLAQQKYAVVHDEAVALVGLRYVSW
jgi:hypothetical protein